MEHQIYSAMRAGRHVRITMYDPALEVFMGYLAMAKIVILSVLIAAVVLFFTLWQREYKARVAFEIKTEKIGQAAKDTNAAIELGNKQRLEAIQNEIPQKLAAARSAAVANYLARLPGVDSGRCPMPGASSGAEVGDGASGERLPAGQLDTEFIQRAASDALKVGTLQDIVRSVPNCLKVE